MAGCHPKLPIGSSGSPSAKVQLNRNVRALTDASLATTAGVARRKDPGDLGVNPEKLLLAEYGRGEGHPGLNDTRMIQRQETQQAKGSRARMEEDSGHRSLTRACSDLFHEYASNGVLGRSGEVSPALEFGDSTTDLGTPRPEQKDEAEEGARENKEGSPFTTASASDLQCCETTSQDPGPRTGGEEHGSRAVVKINATDK